MAENSLTRMTGMLTFALAACCGATAFAQPALPGAPGNVTPSQQVEIQPHPQVWLAYYLGREGYRWKEVAYADLKDWTPALDVYLEFTPAQRDPSRWTVSPDTDARLAPDFKRSLPPRNVWKLRYEPAGIEGQSRLFIMGVDRRTHSARIYTDSDEISFLLVPNVGWYELGAAARLARYLELRQINAASQIPTRSQ